MRSAQTVTMDIPGMFIDEISTKRKSLGVTGGPGRARRIGNPNVGAPLKNYHMVAVSLPINILISQPG